MKHAKNRGSILPIALIILILGCFLALIMILPHIIDYSKDGERLYRIITQLQYREDVIRDPEINLLYYRRVGNNVYVKVTSPFHTYEGIARYGVRGIIKPVPYQFTRWEKVGLCIAMLCLVGSFPISIEIEKQFRKKELRRALKTIL